ncbi:uncharacterized protein LOC120275813 [Dioscorea cayenensis subsp. rotundata]|uniref:Uncharacterized protein LOC120275813 n=1 Tax=Dioscorea cayennensis subsp. rotundata TaxID=55577 RepID=A0AB40CEU8_DIOCR|nr:uncharacterized protein LOC120275813 [Dioscorea cayenensis subsp. rotundata]XP_039138458.1 uncharacterized protein LOC120275813 [Dioscorea cayenensis subsp. rotundata]
MELEQESSKLPGALSATASRNLSSSSSAFVSASQSPFFSPRSPQFNVSEIIRSDDANSSTCNVTSGDPLSSSALIRRLESSSNAKFLASDSPCNPICDADVCSGQGTSNADTRRREKQKKILRSPGKCSLAPSSTSVSSTSRIRSCDVYIGFHGRKPSLLRFVKWLRAELEMQGICCFASDTARCRNSRSHDAVERMMNSASFGVVILTKKSFGNPYSIEELRNFLGRKTLVPIFFDLSFVDCLARDIIERRGELWERHGGELWMLYGGVEKEWRDAVEGLSRVIDLQLEANDGNLRECIFKTVTLLATRMGRRNMVDQVNRWREQSEKEEFPFPRNEEFVGRIKELSELELILFGDVSGDAEREYFELKTKHKRKSLKIGKAEHRREEESTKDQQSESSNKGKDPIIWMKSDKEIEMQRVVGGTPQRSFRTFRTKSGGKYRRKRSVKILYGKGIACVSGDSGIGKTELVLEYAYRFSQRYKMVLWVGGETRYIRQSYLNLRTFLEVDLSTENHSLEKGKGKCFEEQEEDAIAKVRKELMRDIPFLVVIDNLENEKDWWDQKVVMDLLPRFGGETHFIITTRLPKIMNLEPMKLSYLSGMEAMTLMKGSVKDYPIMEIDALRVIEEKLGRLTLGLGIVGAILSELPITPSRLLDTINKMPVRDLVWSDRQSVILRRPPFLMQLIDVCLSIFDHADGPRSLASRMVQVSGWFAPAAIPIPLLAMAAHKVPGKHHGARVWKKFLRAITCSFTSSRIKRSEFEASSMLTRFGIAKTCTKPDSVQFHEIIKLYARKRGSIRVAQAVVQAICLRSSLSLCFEHQWAACFMLFGFSTDPAIVQLKPSELLFFVKRVALPLAIHTFITFSRCAAALELLRLSTDALENAAEAMVTQAVKWLKRSYCFTGPIHSDVRYTYLWQELALLKATLLETRAKLMLRGGQYSIGEDLIQNAIFIRSSIHGDHHPDTISARETLSKLTRLLTNFQVT